MHVQGKLTLFSVLFEAELLCFPCLCCFIVFIVGSVTTVFDAWWLWFFSKYINTKRIECFSFSLCLLWFLIYWMRKPI